MISAVQLHAGGISKRAIERAVRAGRLHPEFRGVYSFGCGVLPPLAREQGALLACGERAFLSHHTSAFIWGLRKVQPVEVEVSVVGRSAPSRKGIRVHRIQAVDRQEVRLHQGLWVSSPARAVLEIAAMLPLADLARAIDDGLANRALTRPEIDAVLARHAGYRGAGRLATVLTGGGGTTITRSEAEKRFLRLIRAARLPPPKTNQPFGRFELDFVWPRERLVVEIDGYQFHSGPASFHRDHEKDLAARDAGLDVLRFTRDHVVKQSEAVLARVAGELARRALSS